MTSHTTQAAHLLPLFVKLAGRRVVLVGGGTVARAKLPGLLGAAADVTVVAPEIRHEIAESGVTLVRRCFEPSDLDGAWFVVAAAPPTINREVAAAADARRILVNAVDDPANATAYLGGVLRRAGVTVAISTAGEAPALAGLLREGIEQILPADLELWTAEARRVRYLWRARGLPMGRRRPALLDALVRLYGRPDHGRRATTQGPGEVAS